MNRSRLISASVCMMVALGIGSTTMVLPGCEPPSEGRPAGSIEVKNARKSAADIEAAKAKVKSSPRALIGRRHAGPFERTPARDREVFIVAFRGAKDDDLLAAKRVIWTVPFFAPVRAQTRLSCWP